MLLWLTELARVTGKSFIYFLCLNQMAVICDKTFFFEKLKLCNRFLPISFFKKSYL